jgi:predicted Zn-ribbon and HTH transcriptional regulator
MSYWVYKCNARGPSYAGSWGDWWKHVFEPGGTREWGVLTLKGVDRIKVGDVLLAYQTDRNELVGTAEMVGFKHKGADRRIVIRPTEIIRTKILPLKADPKIAKLSAFAPGDIRTAYEISPADAVYLLRAARKSVLDSQPSVPVDAKSKSDLLSTFRELPAVERKRVLRMIRLLARTAALRGKVLQIWAPECAACGRVLKDHNGNSECEIAHVRDVHADGVDMIANALPLCRTHHWAFDRGLWAIDPSTMKIRVAKIASKSLKELDGKLVLRPAPVNDIRPLADEHLKWRWSRFKSEKSAAA